MRALQLVAPHRVELVEVPAPSRLAEDDILLRIQAVGICGTDLHSRRRAGKGGVQPLVVGRPSARVDQRAIGI
jgi:L-iditol 2-dehydrogenase